MMDNITRGFTSVQRACMLHVDERRVAGEDVSAECIWLPAVHCSLPLWWSLQ